MYEILKKRYGQNFLIDKNILRKIYQLIPKENLNILEIGPGIGSLTEYIIKTKPKLFELVEIDQNFIPILKDKFSSYKNIKLTNIDILKYKINESIDLIISNLPYNISSQILVKICLSNKQPSNLILMFQKEFALRLIDKKLNSLNSLVQCFYDTKKVFDVSKNCFRPSPKVNSSVLFFRKIEKPLLLNSEIENFISFKQKVFSFKRKSLNKILKNYDLSSLNLDLTQRVESLSIGNLLRIFRKINL
tara:strand:+ start:3104 stop:3844 length:741 start_codon:yes stop_codon:yes gene_type:complete